MLDASGDASGDIAVVNISDVSVVSISHISVVSISPISVVSISDMSAVSISDISLVSVSDMSVVSISHMSAVSISDDVHDEPSLSALIPSRAATTSECRPTGEMTSSQRRFQRSILWPIDRDTTLL